MKPLFSSLLVCQFPNWKGKKMKNKTTPITLGGIGKKPPRTFERWSLGRPPKRLKL
jgi:hypothetical protein